LKGLKDKKYSTEIENDKYLMESDLTDLLKQMVGEYMPIAEKEQLSMHKTVTEERIPILFGVEKIVRIYENFFMS